MGIALIIIGIILLLITIKRKPKDEKDAQNQEGVQKNKWKYRIAGIFFVFVGIGLNRGGDKPTLPQMQNQQTTTQNNNSSVNAEQPKGIGVGEALKTNYFDIVVKKVSLSDRVSTGNQFADKKPEQGSMYLIINASFKNTDTESRMPTDGSVYITYNNKEYEFDKSETIMLEGWGLMLDQINPLITKKTNIVYKIPSEIKGPAYWQPGRSSGNEKIFLGNLK